MIVVHILEWVLQLWVGALWFCLACFGAFCGLAAWAMMLVAICIGIGKKFFWMAATLYVVASVVVVVLGVRLGVMIFDALIVRLT